MTHSKDKTETQKGLKPQISDLNVLTSFNVPKPVCKLGRRPLIFAILPVFLWSVSFQIKKKRHFRNLSRRERCFGESKKRWNYVAGCNWRILSRDYRKEFIVQQRRLNYGNRIKQLLLNHSWITVYPNWWGVRREADKYATDESKPQKVPRKCETPQGCSLVDSFLTLFILLHFSQPKV